MNFFLLKYRILFLLLNFVSGILISEFCENEWLLITVISPVIGALCLTQKQLAPLIFIPLGLLFSAKIPPPDNHIIHFAGKRVDIEGILFRPVETTEKGSKLFIDVKYVYTDSRQKTATGKVLINTGERVWGPTYRDRVKVIGVKLRVPKGFKNPGSFDIKRYYERHGIYLSGFISQTEQILLIRNPGLYLSLPFHFVDTYRVRFGEFIREKSTSPEAEILSAITIGDRGGIPSELRDRFSETGTAHLLAISGLHLGAIAVVFFFTIKWLLKRSEFLLLRFTVPRLAAVLTVIPVIVYTAIAGFSIPVLRACIMTCVYLTSIYIGRDENKLNTLALAAFLILVCYPWSLFDLSFRLSFASVVGILLMHRFYPLKFNTGTERLVSSIKTTVAASLATLPFIVNSFGILPLVSIPANLFAVPVLEFLIVPIGLISFITFILSENLAQFFISLDVTLIKLLLTGIENLTKLPVAFITVPALSKLSTGFYVLTLIALLLKSRYKRLIFLLPLFTVCFVLTLLFSFQIKPKTDYLKMSFLNVGVNESALFLQLPDGKNLLFEGGFLYRRNGGYMERRIVTPFLLRSGITTIDYLILTSVDKNRLDGVNYILRKFKVKEVLTNGSKLNGNLWEAMERKKVLWQNIQHKTNINFGDLNIEFIKPKKANIRDSREPYPILCKLSFKDTALFFGESILDREFKDSWSFNGKNNLLYLQEIEKNSIDVIKELSPNVLITRHIPYSLKNGMDKNTKVFETDTNGTVTVITDGKEVYIKTFMDEYL